MMTRLNGSWPPLLVPPYSPCTSQLPSSARWLLSSPFPKTDKLWFSTSPRGLVLEDRGGPHARADAHGHHAVALVGAPQLVQQRRDLAGTRAAQRMAQCNGSTLRIHLKISPKYQNQRTYELHIRTPIHSSPTDMDSMPLVVPRAGQRRFKGKPMAILSGSAIRTLSMGMPSSRTQ